jgi:hypothetical protein
MPEQQFQNQEEDRGLLAIALNSAATVGEKAVTGGFGFLREARNEVSQRTLALIDWVDSVQQSSTKIVRSVVQRSNDFVLTCIDSGEKVSLAAVRTAYSTSNGAAGLASRTASSLTSTKSDVVAAA